MANFTATIRTESIRPSSSIGQRPQSAALEAIGARPRQAQRRPTKQASYELANHAKAYIEGGKVASGFEFLTSLLAAGTSISTPAQPYLGLLAPPAYIAFGLSLIADPSFTTQAPSSDAQQASDAALRYLQCIHSIVDAPAYPTIRKAFIFTDERTRRRAPGYRSEANSLSPGGPGGDIERLAGPAANEKSLWRHAEDFWHIVGWAFNCSIAHKKRWDRWKLWLGITLDFLEADWHVCVKEGKDALDPAAVLQKSLLWHYVVGEAESTTRSMRRRIVKAILATASSDSRRDYPEVWPRETYELKRKAQKEGPISQVNFETGDIGDYGSDDEMQDILEQPEDDHDVPKSKPSTGGDSIRNVLDACQRLGGQEAIDLRQRLIALLARLAQELPLQFTKLSDFFDNILEEVVHLPTITFHVLISTTTLPSRSKIAFLANLLVPLVSGFVPDYFQFDPAPEHLETILLPLKTDGQSFAVNAKITLVLEQMFLYTMQQNTLTPTQKLRQTMEDGIKARQSVYGAGKGKKGNAEEESQATELMATSSNRLLGLLEILEMSAKNPAHTLTVQGRKDAAPAKASFTSGSSLSPAPDSATEEENTEDED
ncbi:hypothetical protein NX059_008153 [Plenodomus lindquistii]|nr:hypothetical protein NX059_008153 [Plenodomus lindquistii]